MRDAALRDAEHARLQLQEQAIELEAMTEALRATAAHLEEQAAATEEARARLAEHAERVQLALAAGAILGTWFWDLPTDRFTVDEGFAVNFGLDPALGRDGLSLDQVIATVHPDDRDGLIAAIDAVIARGGPYAHQYRVRRRDGRYYWIEANGRVDHDADGTPRAFPGVLLDVEERRRTLEALRESEERFREIADNMSQFAWTADASGAIHWYNRRWYEYTGTTLEQMRGWGWRAVHHPDHVDGVVARFAAAIAAGEPWEDTFPLRARDGTWRWFLSRAVPIRDAAGRVARWFGTNTDVTAQREADARAAEAERHAREVAERERARLAEILDRLPVGVVVVDATAGVVHENAASVRTIGRSLREVAALPDYATHGGGRHADGRPYAPEDYPIARALLHGEAVHQELTRYRRADGADVVLSISASPVRDDEGRIVAAVAALDDVTAREAARLTLAERTAQLQAVMASPALVLATCDRALRYTSIQNPHRDFAPAAVLGRRDDELLPPDSPAARALVALKQGVIDGGEPARALLRVPLSDGDRVYEMLAQPVRDDAGAVVAVSTIGMDVTARERATAALAVNERRLRTVFDQAPVVIATLRGPDHVVEIQNADHRTLFGGRDLVGRPLREGAPELVGQGFLELLDRVYATGAPFVGTEARALLDRGRGLEEAWFNFVYQPLYDAEGRVEGILSVATEVTAQVRARREVEAERTAAQEAQRAAERARAAAVAERARAEEANQAKADFLASMSHELRTPLNAIGGYVQLMEMELHGPVTDAQREALGRVQGAQRHLLRLINDVLNFAKLEAGKVEYDVRAVRLGDVLAQVVPLVEPQMAAKRHAFAVEVADPDVRVWADAEKLAQVLLNLLSNAMKFTEPGGRVRVDAPRRADGSSAGDVLHLRVTDTGRGIPAGKLESVFAPFVQVETGHTRSADGTGLGLAISRDLMRGMGGEVRARSTEGVGSAFTLTLRCVARTDGTVADRRSRDERRVDERRVEPRRE